jgi:tRNA modification GTPase
VHGTLSIHGRVVDDAVVTYFESPSSFTGEDSVEIACHGNPLIVRDIVAVLIDAGARMAEPGEFARRAFLSGRIDLTGAEAINQIVIARSSWEISSAIAQMHGSLKREIESLREKLILLKGNIECSIDFSTEEIEFVSYHEARSAAGEVRANILDIRRRCVLGRRISRGVDLPLAGKPNAGKSSILNYLLNAERAIVSEIPGTTRDLIRETIQFGGIHVNLIDTAGIHESDSLIEKIGIAKSEQIIESSEIVIVVCDASTGATDDDRDILKKVADRKKIVLANKADIAAAGAAGRIASELGCAVIPFSAVTGEGFDSFEREVTRLVTEEFSGSHDTFIADERIMRLLDEALHGVDDVEENLSAGDPHEIVAHSLLSCIETLGEITGTISPDDVLDAIFSRFCIGK